MLIAAVDSYLAMRRTLGVSEPKTEDPAHGEVGINGRAQHDGTSGQGWATFASSRRSTLA